MHYISKEIVVKTAERFGKEIDNNAEGKRKSKEFDHIVFEMPKFYKS